MKPLYL